MLYVANVNQNSDVSIDNFLQFNIAAEFAWNTDNLTIDFVYEWFFCLQSFLWVSYSTLYRKHIHKLDSKLGLQANWFGKTLVMTKADME